MSEIQFHTVNSQEGIKLAEWRRTFGVRDDGEYYVPAAAAGNEQKVMLCANYDGTPIAYYKDHLYVPLSWAKKEFPSANENLKIIEDLLKELRISYSK